VSTAPFFLWGGESDSGPSGGVIVLLVLAFMVGVPAVAGLLLRRRDAKRDQTGSGIEDAKEPPPKSGRFSSWDASEPFNFRAPSTRQDWLVVAGFAAGFHILLLVASP
jgi:hypothetical protein